MHEKELKPEEHPKLEDLPPELISEILKDLPILPSDVVGLVMDECKERGITPTVEVLHLVLREWLKGEQNRKDAKAAGNYRLVDKTIKIVSSTISLWYSNAHGMRFRAFAETDTDYYVLATYQDGEVVVHSVHKSHAE